MEPNQYRTQAAHLEDIYTVLRKTGIAFSKNEAAKIVGGRGRLERLAAEGKIKAKKKGKGQNSPWECNGEDVLRYASENISISTYQPY